MGTFLRDYKFWLWDSDATQWREVDKAIDFTMQYKLNRIPTFKSRFVLTDENLQDLMTAGTPWRVTNNDSTDGTVKTGLLGETLNETGAATDSREIMAGVLKEPESEERTAQRNGKPVLWQVDGVGYADRAKRIVRDSETSRSGTAKSVIDAYINSDIPDSSSIALGTRDTGPTIDVKHRKDELFPALLDIAVVGDGTDNFFYYIHFNDDGSRTPQLNYLSPTNSLFETTDPTGGTDNGRVIDEATEARRVKVTNEEKRIKNAVKIRYGGIGSGTAQNETGFQTDSSSITAFGRREEIRYAPWVQDSTTATTLRDTLEDMYDGEDFSGGTYDGIKRAKVTLRKGQLFQSGFDAHPGDVVAVERSSGTIVVGRFLGFEFEQVQERLTVEIGLPRAAFLDDVASAQRTQRQAINSFEVTQTGLSTETTPVDIRDTSLSAGGTLTPATFANIAANGGSANEDFALTTQEASELETAHIMQINVDIASQNFHDGGLIIALDARTSSGSFIETLVAYTFGVMQPSVFYNGGEHSYPFGLDETPDEIRVRITNDGPVDFSLDTGTFRIRVVPQHEIDLSHDHNF